MTNRSGELPPVLGEATGLTLRAPFTQRSAFAALSVAGRRSAAAEAFSVVLLGKRARAALASEVSWTVLAVFRRSLYCVSTRGSLLCFGPLPLGAGPLNVLAAFPPNFRWQDTLVRPGTAAACDGASFRLDGRFEFLLVNGRVWKPDLPSAEWDAGVLSQSLRALEREVLQRAPVDGLAPVIPHLLIGRPMTLPGSGLPRALIRNAAPGIAVLRMWLESTMPASVILVDPPDAAECLVGLGPGLTPSGDDLLGGTLIALRALGWPRVADTLGSWLLLRARARTHAISYAHLACAAEGEGAAALHDTLAALCSPNAPRLGEYVDALGNIGHSSGWDSLAGVALVAKVAAASRAAGQRDSIAGRRPASP